MRSLYSPVSISSGWEMPLVSTLPLKYSYGQLGAGRLNNSFGILDDDDDGTDVGVEGRGRAAGEAGETAAAVSYADDNSSFSNGSLLPFNNMSTWDEASIFDGVFIMSLTAFVLGLVILATVIGNVFVIAAILLEKNLQSVANYLILSLAFADLFVACLVMPLGAVYEVSKQWTLGPELCDMWTSSDVLCCTASILHLVAIAVDRYWAVTNIDYIHHRNGKRIGIMIFIIWTVSFLISLAPVILDWKDPEWDTRVNNGKMCLVSQDVGYQIFATLSSFYVPLAVILILYWRIFQTARKRIRRKGATMYRHHHIGRGPPTMSETTCTTFTTVSSSDNPSPEKSSCTNGTSPMHMDSNPRRKFKDSLDSKRERKAAKTLAIITGAFVVCWLPFFIMAILMPVCTTCDFNEYMVAFFLWLGYFNSTLNPIIYTIFSPEFRTAFQKILCGKKAHQRRKTRHSAKRYMV